MIKVRVAENDSNTEVYLEDCSDGGVDVLAEQDGDARYILNIGEGGIKLYRHCDGIGICAEDEQDGYVTVTKEE